MAAGARIHQDDTVAWLVLIWPRFCLDQRLVQDPTNQERKRMMKQTEKEQTEQIVGETVNIQDGGAAVIKGNSVSIKDGGAFMIQGQDVTIRDGGGAVIMAETVSMQDGGGAVMLARQAEVKDASILLLVAKSVSGDAKVMVDLKAAVVFGLVAGLVVGLLKHLLRRI